MKKCPYLCLILPALLLFSSCTVVSTLNFTDNDVDNTPNLIANPSFNPYSDVAADALKSWVVHLDPPGGESSPVNIDPGVSLDGGTSLRIDASDKSVMVLSDPFPVRRYGGYYVRTSFKTNTASPPQAQMRMIVFMDNGKIVNRFKKRFQITSEWERQTLSAGFIKPGAKFGRLAYMIPPFKEGSIWIDVAGCYEVHSFHID
ncbi:MAG: hypothetical protein CVU50_05895 [Candidatus Cloacimonetes bacterium HGW-Cloacimonetes-3]|jgi:hypothetical protein|nr:MAG: hypothetical protein CVU50_05895 [Candidatus Cloacimonetes bacterium HGW-Cloacimonetes-3]